MEKNTTLLWTDENFTDPVSDNLGEKYSSKEVIIAEIEECFKKNEDMLLRLSNTALKYIRNYFFRDTIGDLTSEDVVHIVLEKIITGKRRWNREKFPDILDFIRLTILSFVLNERKRKVEFESVDLYNENGELEEWRHEDYLTACLNKDFTEGDPDQCKCDRLLNLLLQRLVKDEDAIAVLDKRLAGLRSNIEIAKELSFSVRKVENAMKRIKRRFEEKVKR